LLAKEAAESRARLESLPAGERRVEKATRIGGSDIRRRQLGDIASILGGRPIKRRKTEAPRIGKGGRRVNTSSEDEEPEEEPRVERKRKHDSREDKEEGRESRSHRSHHPRHRSVSEDRGEDKEDRKKRHRSRSRSPKDGRSKDSRRRHRSPRRKRSRSPEEEKSREKSHRSHRCRRSPSKARRESKKESRVVKEPEPRPDDDSDPLDEIIGPRPPPVPEVRSRGRGTMSHASGIDSRFSANYDPTVDVQLDPDEENDWDQALEALRDRQKWKQQGADRLRSAGFTDEEIKKWEKGGEKSVEDVTWAKKGEGREWDRGKVFDDEGGVKIDPEFGRLKDT
jgi:flagellar biosynthesis GTPase FlhF